MSAPIDHKKPTVAFVVLFVLVSAILGNGLRARADDLLSAFAHPTTIEAAAVAPSVRTAPPASDVATPAPVPTGSRGVSPEVRAAGSHERHATGSGHREAPQASRPGVRGPIGHRGASAAGLLGAHGVPRAGVHPGTGSLASVRTGLHRPAPRAAGVPVRVAARRDGVEVRVRAGGLGARVRLSLRSLHATR